MFDSLGDFKTEGEEATEEPRAPGAVSIAEVQARSVALEWFEAVAITQALCDRLGESRVRVGAATVFLGPAGTVEATGVTLIDDLTARQQVADLLRTMLPDMNVPAALRLTLSQAASSISLAEWAKAVAYYERPNRPAIISAVYQRALYSAPQVAPQVSLEIPPPRVSAIAPAVVPPASSLRVPAFTRKHMLVAAAAVLVAALLAAGTWMLRGSSRNDAAQQSVVSSAPTPVGETVATTPQSVLEQVVSRIPFIGDRSPVAPSASEPMALPKGEWIRLYPHKDGARLGLAPMMAGSQRSSAELGTGEPAKSVEAGPEKASISASDSNRIYSAADLDVTPPVATYPQFPSAPPLGAGPNDIAEFEVVVNETGGVDSVRARRVPATMSEAVRVTMSLSAAKAWRFIPGSKNGEPVKYRKVVWVLKN